MNGHKNCPNCGESKLIEFIAEVPSVDFRKADFYKVYLCHVCYEAYAIPRRVHESKKDETSHPAPKSRQASKKV